MEMETLYNLEDRFDLLLEKDETNKEDLARKSLFYIIAGNYDLYFRANHIYDFKNRNINTDCLKDETMDFSSNSRKLIKIGFNLYNGYNNPPSDILSLFSGLDKDNFNLAIQAMRIKFNVQEDKTTFVK